MYLYEVYFLCFTSIDSHWGVGLKGTKRHPLRPSERLELFLECESCTFSIVLICKTNKNKTPNPIAFLCSAPTLPVSRLKILDFTYQLGNMSMKITIKQMKLKMA